MFLKIKEKFNNVIEYLTPNLVENQSMQELKEFKVLIAANLIMMIFLFLFILSHTFSNTFAFIFIDTIALCNCALIIAYFRKTRQKEISSFLTFLNGTLTITITDYLIEIPQAYHFIWIPIIAGWTTFLLRGRWRFFANSFLVILFIYTEEFRRMLSPWGVKWNAEQLQSNNNMIVFAGVLIGYQTVHMLLKEQEKVMSLYEQELEANKNLSASKSSFINLVTHDIANPLMAVVASAERLQTKMEKNDVDGHKMVDRIIRNGRRITEIIASVRKIQALKSGKLILDIKKVSLSQAIKESLDVFVEKAEKKKIIFRCIPSLDELENLYVTADYEALVTHVLQNILSNAIKFSKEGQSIEILVEQKKQSCVIVAIRDFGIGIPNELLAKLFDETSATSRIGTSGEKGTGFGLPLARKIVRSFNGDIIVTSSTEVGQSWTHCAVHLKVA